MSFFGGDTKECRACREDISTEAETCPHCGEPQAGLKMFGGDLKECRACREDISTEAETCPHCGEPQDGLKMFGGSLKDCRSCDRRISTEAETCPHCGEPQEGLKMFGGDLKECRACREDISTEAETCPHCGEPQAGLKMFGGYLVDCRTCGARISSEAEECPNCGELLIERSDDDENDSSSNYTTKERTENNESRYSASSYDSDYSSNESYSGNYETSPSSTSNSATGIITVIVLIAAGWFIYSQVKKDKSKNTSYSYQENQGTSNSEPIYNPPQPVTQEPVSSNPYGEGNGRVSFYRSGVMGDNTQLYFEENQFATINECPWHDAECGGQGTFSVNVPAGMRLFIFKDELGQMWKEYIDVPEFGCVLFEVSTPGAADDDDDGLEDGLTYWKTEIIPDVIKNSNAGRSMYCPQCLGVGERQLNAYCTVCTWYGLGGVAYNGYVNCSDCNGRGAINDQTCMTCKQTGKVECSNCSGKGRALTLFKCNLCMGDGKIAL